MSSELSAYGLFVIVVIICITIFACVLTLSIAFGFETENMTAYENTLLKICMDYNIETFECYQIYGDIESTYEPPK